MPGKTLHIKNRDDLQIIVSNNDFVIVKVGATWCGPCNRIKPIVNTYFQQMPDNVHLVHIDADEGQDACAALKVKVLPTFINFIKGEQKDIYATGDQTKVKQFFESTLQYVKNG